MLAERPPGAELLQFADSVIKINKRDKQQGRVLVLTDCALYNFRPGVYNKCRRRIPFVKISGVILSQSSDELVFQIQNDYDYRYAARALSSRCYGLQSVEVVQGPLDLCFEEFGCLEL